MDYETTLMWKYRLCHFTTSSDSRITKVESKQYFTLRSLSVQDVFREEGSRYITLSRDHYLQITRNFQAVVDL